MGDSGEIFKPLMKGLYIINNTVWSLGGLHCERDDLSLSEVNGSLSI